MDKTTSNKLVWPSATDGLSGYICQFSSKWWPSEAFWSIVCSCSMLHWLKIGREEARCGSAQRQEFWKCTATPTEFPFLREDFTGKSAYWSRCSLPTAAPASDLWDILWDQQKWRGCWIHFLRCALVNQSARPHFPQYKTTQLSGKVTQCTKATHLVETVKPLVGLGIKVSDADEAEKKCLQPPQYLHYYRKVYQVIIPLSSWPAVSFPSLSILTLK